MNEKPVVSFVELLIQKSFNVSDPEVAHQEGVDLLQDSQKQAEGLSDDEKADLILNQVNFRKSMAYTDFESAIKFQSAVLSLTLKRWGERHMRSVNARCTLAQAYRQNRAPGIAKRIYAQALNTVTRFFPNAKATQDEIRDLVEQCSQAERLSIGSAQLLTYMGRMQHAPERGSKRHPAQRAEQLLRIANQLYEKKRYLWSAAAFDSWHQLCMPCADLQDEFILVNLARYGQALMKEGRARKAQGIFKQVVTARNIQYPQCPTGILLQKALLDWAESLSQSGSESSAAMTFRLAYKVEKPTDLEFLKFKDC